MDIQRRLFCFCLLFSPLINSKENTAHSCVQVDNKSTDIYYEVNTVTDFNKHHIHSYYDLNPDNPSGKDLLCFRFSDQVPGVGDIIINREFDPKKALVIAKGISGTAHEAALQQWLTDEIIAYVDNNKENVTTEIVSSSAKHLMRITGGLRSANSRTMLGLFSSHELRRPKKKLKQEFLRVIDLKSGDIHLNIVLDDLLQEEALNKILKNVTGYKIKHPKWSPDGNHFFFVLFNNKSLEYGPRKILILSDRDGNNISYIGENIHHPVWGRTGNNIYYFKGEGKEQTLYKYDITLRYSVTVMKRMTGDHINVHPSGKLFVVDKVTRSKSRDGQILILNDAGEILTRLSYKGDNISYRKRLHSHPIWSRDGCSVFANIIENGVRGVVKIDYNLA
ncbi:MAG: hypothetical protein AB2810_17960 [Candidatus Thiodiazotropha endolucinida]